MQRTHAWRTPPRWCPRDWLEEIDAESIASACQAIRIFEPDRGPSLESFVYHRVLAGALSRYRKEWSHALRCIRSPSLKVEAKGTDEVDDQDAAAVEEKRIRRSMIDLPEKDRRLIECLFWEGRTEKDVAGGLGITQQAVNKRKRRILVQLRTNLANVNSDVSRGRSHPIRDVIDRGTPLERSSFDIHLQAVLDWPSFKSSLRREPKRMRRPAVIPYRERSKSLRGGPARATATPFL